MVEAFMFIALADPFGCTDKREERKDSVQKK
jgi:hypothetical protein